MNLSLANNDSCCGYDHIDRVIRTVLCYGEASWLHLLSCEELHAVVLCFLYGLLFDTEPT
jgi:hypothetical protein